MNAIKVVFAVWAAVAVSSLSTVVLGDGGMLALGKLESERDRLAENMKDLKRINAELLGSVGEMRSDPDSLKVHARELGFAESDDQRFIRVADLSGAVERTAQAGNKLRADRPRAVSDAVIRVVSMTVGVCVLVLLGGGFKAGPSDLLSSIRQGGKRREKLRLFRLSYTKRR